MRLWAALLFLFVSCTMSNNTEQIIIHGHRGCRGLLPENTMPSFYKALDLGCEALEIDLVCTGDGKMLISHDPFMAAEICTKPDGSLISSDEERTFNIYKMSLSEAQSYICGTLPHPRFPEQQQLLTHKPSFVEFVSGIKEYCKQRDLPFPVINIEIKSEQEWDSVYQPIPDEFADIFLKEFNSLRIVEHSLIQSFDPRILESINKKQAGLKLMYLVEEEEKDVAKNLSALSFKPYSYNPHYSLVDETTVKYCGDNGIEIMVWTVNEEVDMKRLISLGIRNIITDYPDRANKVVGELERESK